MTFPWITSKLRGDELEESIQDVMREEGLDPNNIRDNALFAGRANRHAVLAGEPYRQISAVDNDTKETFPQPSWLERKCGLKSVDMNADHESTNIDRGYLPSRQIKAG